MSKLSLLHGIDISHHNDKVNLETIAKEQKFVFMKASEGLTYVDPAFKARWQGLGKLNAQRGAYHFFRADKDPVIQARHFCETVGALEGKDFPLVCDVETMDGKSGSSLIIALQIFMDEVERISGKTPIIYSGHSFIEDLKLPKSFARYPLWVAHYSEKPETAPAPWSDWTFWQYSEAERINGVGVCDVNWFKGHFV